MNKFVETLTPEQKLLLFEVLKDDKDLYQAEMKRLLASLEVELNINTNQNGVPSGCYVLQRIATIAGKFGRMQKKVYILYNGKKWIPFFEEDLSPEIKALNHWACAFHAFYNWIADPSSKEKYAGLFVVKDHQVTNIQQKQFRNTFDELDKELK